MPKTALQAARTPNLDALAEEGITGMLSPLGQGVIPTSDTSHLQLLGYGLREFYPGRGPLEALGMGIKMQKGDVAFRANFATVKNGRIVDRRAGRIGTEEARKLERDVNMKIEDVRIIFKSSVEHRGALVLRGTGLSTRISDTDTHHTGEMATCKPLDAIPEARKTARIVDQFTKAVKEKLERNPVNKGRKLPANIVLLRSPGSYRKVPSMQERFGIRGACIAGGALYKGVARYIGMDVLKVKGATGTAETDLKAKARAAVRASRKYDLVFIHVKAADSFGHDGDFKGKVKMLERIDKELVAALRKSQVSLVVTGDHATPCIQKAHSDDKVPILVYGKKRDTVKKFDEISAREGKLGHITGKEVIGLIRDLLRHPYGLAADAAGGV